jgi:hypothetical protein
MSEGYIYLRRQVGHGYCFGKTSNEKRRDSQYRKENPFLKKVDCFYTADMDAAEQELIAKTQSFRLLSNSKEWVRECQEILVIWGQSKAKHAGDAHLKTIKLREAEEVARAKKQFEQDRKLAERKGLSKAKKLLEKQAASLRSRIRKIESAAKGSGEKTPELTLPKRPNRVSSVCNGVIASGAAMIFPSLHSLWPVVLVIAVSFFWALSTKRHNELVRESINKHRSLECKIALRKKFATENAPKLPSLRQQLATTEERLRRLDHDLQSM